MASREIRVEMPPGKRKTVKERLIETERETEDKRLRDPEIQ